jgi:hypothetical protein
MQVSVDAIRSLSAETLFDGAFRFLSWRNASSDRSHHASLAAPRRVLRMGDACVGYFEDARAPGTPAILVHDLLPTSSAEDLRVVFDALRTMRPVITVDLPCGERGAWRPSATKGLLRQLLSDARERYATRPDVVAVGASGTMLLDLLEEAPELACRSVSFMATASAPATPMPTRLATPLRGSCEHPASSGRRGSKGRDGPTSTMRWHSPRLCGPSGGRRVQGRSSVSFKGAKRGGRASLSVPSADHLRESAVRLRLGIFRAS